VASESFRKLIDLDHGWELRVIGLHI
jgi:hypothetical protein